jgi:SAM-dependent methyltransferase
VSGATEERSELAGVPSVREPGIPASSEGDKDLWERNARWWQDEFTDGADPEYVEQIVPLATECLDGATRVLDVGTGEGQLARMAAKLGAWVVGLDPTLAQLSVARARGDEPYVRGTAGALPFADATFDAVIVCLVFEHIADYEPPIDEIARVLEPGGRFVFFLNHPLLQAPNSGWVIDHILEEEYWRVGPYLVEDVTMEELAPGVTLPFVHRPLSQYVNAMARNGLLIERMEEPMSPEGFLAKAEEYRAAATIPRLLLLSARKR